MVEFDKAQPQPNSQQYTRADWRPSKRYKYRLRKNHYGGRKTAHPNFLEGGKATQFTKGRPGHRVCSATKRDGTPCRRLALKGLRVCGGHGGFAQCAIKGILRRTGKKALIQAQRAARVDEIEGAPLELARMPAYQAAPVRVRQRMVLAWGTESWTNLISQIGTNECV